MTKHAKHFFAFIIWILQTGRTFLQKERKILLSMSLTFSFSCYTPVMILKWNADKTFNHFETIRGNKELSNLIQVTLNAALKIKKKTKKAF